VDQNGDFADYFRFWHLQVLSSNWGVGGTRGFSLMMVGAGLFALMLGILDHSQNMRALREEYPTMPRLRAGVNAALILILGLLAFDAMIFRQ
jgi:hypothetical protein